MSIHGYYRQSWVLTYIIQGDSGEKYTLYKVKYALTIYNTQDWAATVIFFFLFGNITW